MADKDKTDDQEELIAVIGDEAEGTAETLDEDGKPAKVKEGEEAEEAAEGEEEAAEGEEEEGEGKEAKAEGDARVATDADADNKDTRKRETSKERRQRQKAHAQRREKELLLYRTRNEQLERRFSQMEARQMRGEQITITQAITTVDAQIADAKRLEAEAITSKDGASAVEARDIVDALETKKDRLVAAKERAARPAERTPPPEMRQAMGWIERNKDWYDPKAGDETSAIASAIEDRLSREGDFDPATPEFWKELDRRLVKRGIKKAAAAEPELDLDDEDEVDDPKPPKTGKLNGKVVTAKANGGPKVSVGGERRSLKPNEVYIDPERKKAMVQAGVWDDPKLRQAMLKRYHQYDRDASASRAN